MGDVNNFNFYAVITDPDVRKAVRAELDDYTGTYVYNDEETTTTLSFAANGVSQGSVDTCFASVLAMIRDGVDGLPIPDFPFTVNDEPQYEFLGSYRIHVPGLPDFAGDCDADGNVVISVDELLKTVDEATDLETLRADLAVRTGRLHFERLRNLGAPTSSV